MRRHISFVQVRTDIIGFKVTDTIAESTFANLDIVTQVISSCVILLADSREVQDDLLEEMERNQEGKEEYIARKDTLLHYCLLEALRLRPVLCECRRLSILCASTEGYGILTPASIYFPREPSSRKGPRELHRPQRHYRHRGRVRHQHPESLLGTR